MDHGDTENTELAQQLLTLEDLMRTAQTIFVLIFMIMVVVSCRMAEKLAGGPSAGTVSSLWPDVPPFDGATKANLEIPLGARLVIRAAMQGQVNFIAFTTDKSAKEVQDFYTKERMKTAGWTPNEKGCIGDSEEEKSQGAVCLYGRKDGDKPEGLAIVIAQDQKKKETEIFYVRIELPPPTPSPSR
jgi:hypothetical protein